MNVILALALSLLMITILPRLEGNIGVSPTRIILLLLAMLMAVTPTNNV
jgi:hypothetical protein